MRRRRLYIFLCGVFLFAVIGSSRGGTPAGEWAGTGTEDPFDSDRGNTIYAFALKLKLKGKKKLKGKVEVTRNFNPSGKVRILSGKFRPKNGTVTIRIKRFDPVAGLIFRYKFNLKVQGETMTGRFSEKNLTTGYSRRGKITFYRAP